MNCASSITIGAANIAHSPLDFSSSIMLAVSSQGLEARDWTGPGDDPTFAIYRNGVYFGAIAFREENVIAARYLAAWTPEAVRALADAVEAIVDGVQLLPSGAPN